jgi:hypothetical protein
MEITFSNFRLPESTQSEEQEGQNVSPRTDTQTSHRDRRHPAIIAPSGVCRSLGPRRSTPSRFFRA